uniref:Growth hormone-inducible transmembrane protein n=1 Tax=Globodera pallida TaxID=36090 RepID=A0A183BRZ6_GLOPA
MLSRILLQPNNFQAPSFRYLTTSALSKARYGFRQSGAGQYEALTARRAAPTLRERLLGPTTGKPFIVGTYALAGASVFGMGMLCYYGLTTSADSAAFRSALWPNYVRERLQSTYAYLAGSLALTAGAGMAAARIPAVLAITSAPSLLVWFGSLAAIIGSGIVVQKIDFHQNSAAKHLAWMAHCGILGAVLAPLCFVGGPALMRAAWYTAGLVGGLSATAICAPSEKFLNMAGPLSMGLGVVFVACLGSFAFPPNTALGASLASVVVYGGLILFSMFLLHDTQRVIKMAEGQHHYSRFGGQQMQLASPYQYDPINAQLSIYMDILNIFMRLAMILGGGQRQ